MQGFNSLRTNRDSAMKNRPVKLRKQPPALTTTRKDRAMADRADITPELIRQLFSFDAESGSYFWEDQPAELFCSNHAYKVWKCRFSGKEALTRKDRQGYRVVTIHGHHFMAHRVVWAFHYGKWPDGELDHINGVRSDNRLANLRDVSHQINHKNRKMQSNNTSGAVGVRFNKRERKWVAAIGGRSLGKFASMEEAILARKSAEAGTDYHPNHGRPA